MDSGKKNIRNTEIRAVKATLVINCDQKTRRVWKNKMRKPGRDVIMVKWNFYWNFEGMIETERSLLWQTNCNTSKTTASQYSKKQIEWIKFTYQTKAWRRTRCWKQLLYMLNGIAPFWDTILCLLSAIISCARIVCEADLKI